MRERETKGTATERFAAQRETVPPRRTERSTLRAPQGPIRLKKLCHWTRLGISCEILTRPKVPNESWEYRCGKYGESWNPEGSRARRGRRAPLRQHVADGSFVLGRRDFPRGARAFLLPELAECRPRGPNPRCRRLLRSRGRQRVPPLHPRGDHAVRGFYNVCRHRGTRIVGETEGSKLGSLVCPYHAWTYSTEGKLVGAPHTERLVDFSKEEYGLRAVRVDTWGGFVWATLDDPGPTLREEMGEFFARFPRFDFEGLRLGARRTY